MKEYIEREALLELYQIDGPENETGHVPLPVIRQNIMDIPAADVAEVVRCRDCKNLCVGGVWFGDARWGCKILEVSVDLDFFCGFGERKEDGNETS